jgi:hypothetical protein
VLHVTFACKIFSRPSTKYMFYFVGDVAAHLRLGLAHIKRELLV